MRPRLPPVRSTLRAGRRPRPRGFPAHLDIPYAAKVRTKWDLYPAADADVPWLVHIHGGFWQRNSLEDVVGQHVPSARLGCPQRVITNCREAS